MNPRHFCRQPAYQKALLLTYSFDPVFFEKLVLPDLWAGRSSDILAMGDRQQILDATSASGGQIWHLGNKYLLAQANHDGAFHPKMILRLGSDHGAVMFGSGNLTSSGWGGNQELGACWKFGPDYGDKGIWLPGLLADIKSWCSSEIERDAISRMQDVGWLGGADASQAISSLLYSRASVTLSASLAQRWAGRQFDSVRILTGSTDQSGAFLRWAHDTFGIRKATVALTPAMASFDPEQLADLPIEVSLVEAPSEKPLHAKFYWFEGETGTAAIMGSANCSAAAWLQPATQGGNIETVVVYDTADTEAYQDVLDLFDGPTSSAHELLEMNSDLSPEPEQTRKRYHLTSLCWSQEAGEITAQIRPAPPPGSSVELALGAQILTLSSPSQSDEHWSSPLVEVPGNGTVFGYVEILSCGERYKTSLRWVDDLVSLRDANYSYRLALPFNEIERNPTPKEQQQMLEGLREIQQMLFNETAAFRDPGTNRKSIQKEEDASERPPVNPDDLVCDLEDRSILMPDGGVARPQALSINGILRALFQAEGVGAEDEATAEDENLDEGMSNPNNAKWRGNDSRGDGTQAPKSDEAGEEEISAHNKKKMAAHIVSILEHLRAPDFAETCTAIQMVQAVVYPLALVFRGVEKGWVDPVSAEHWAVDVIDILIMGSGKKNQSLLRTVELRYAESEQVDIFADVVGNGTLWLVLIATLGYCHWHGPGMYMAKAAILRRVYTTQSLLASATPANTQQLIGQLRIDNAKQYVTAVAPKVNQLLGEIEEHMQSVWVAEADVQAEKQTLHQVGDLLWRAQVGWAICLDGDSFGRKETQHVQLNGCERNIAANYYVNVSECARHHIELQSKLEHLRCCIENVAST